MVIVAQLSEYSESHQIVYFKMVNFRDFPGVHWLRLCASTAGSSGLIPGQRTKFPHAVWCSQKKNGEFYGV